MNLLDDLNPQQREAVLATEGPVLILAGAGTGKTRVITYRIAHMMEEGVPGNSILAVTFTNKAAAQMRDRVQVLRESRGGFSSDPWISTFHSFCVRLLRREAARLGLPRDFAIYDDDDQQAAIKLAIATLGLSDTGDTPRVGDVAASAYAKNHGITPAQSLADAFDDLTRRTAKLYEAYEQMLKQSRCARFRRSPAARGRCAAPFRRSPRLLAAALPVPPRGRIPGHQQRAIRFAAPAGGRKSQSLRRGRRGSVHLSLARRGRRQHSALQRGVPRRASAAHRAELPLAPEDPGRRRRSGLEQYAPHRQATFCDTRGRLESCFLRSARRSRRSRIRRRERVAEISRDDFNVHLAVLYRTNAQSRSFEEAFRTRGMRYRLLGGFSFYQRAEVKDALAYVRLAMFPDDDIALLRVLNTPPRGIGKVTIDALRSIAKESGGSLWKALGQTVDAGGSRALAPLRSFRELIEELREQGRVAFSRGLSPLRSRLHRLYGHAAAARLRRRYRARRKPAGIGATPWPKAAERGETLNDFLDRAALVSDADNFDESASVTLLTLHTAKGLEFDHVFLTGLEEGTFPHNRCLNNAEELEEERRLCYVGMTRARETLTHYSRRLSPHLRQRTPASLDARRGSCAEIPRELVDTAPGSLSRGRRNSPL